MFTRQRWIPSIIVLVFLGVAGNDRAALAAPDMQGFELIATATNPGSQYVTLTSQGYITLWNVSAMFIHVTSISSTDPDAAGGYLRVNALYPINIAAGDSVHVPVVFAPNAPDIVSGERTYTAQFSILSESPRPLTVTLTGVGVLIHAQTSIASTFRGKVGDTLTVPVMLDTWIDPLGSSDVRGMRFELTHYRRTIVGVQPAYNTGGAGQTGTITAGATVVEDLATDTLSDPAHSSGEQGFYSLLMSNMALPVRAMGTLLNMRFAGLKGTDTSQLTMRVRDFRNAEGASLAYVIMTSAPGLIHIDSVKHVDTSTAVHGFAGAPAQNKIVLYPSAPNPFAASTDIAFTLQDRTRAELYVCDVRGRVITTLVRGDLSAGEHHAQFSAGALPSGEYYAVLRTPAGVVKQEMGLVR